MLRRAQQGTEGEMGKRRGVRCLGILLPFLLALFLAGCQVTENAPTESAEETGKEYKVSYMNSTGTGLVSVSYFTETTDQMVLVSELMEQFMNVPKEVECQVALSDKVAYQGARLEQSVLYVYFDSNYAAMDSVREILCRSALAKTLTQLTFVDHVMIYSGEQPLMDHNGNPVGMFSDSDFISSITDVNEFERRTVILYFTDEEGTALFPEERELIHNVNSSMEKLVVSELIKGPEESGHSPVLPADVKLLGVSIKDNICYLNFDDTFLKSSLEVKPEIPIYAIVNSLSELSSVNKIQITIKGYPDVMFRDTLSLNSIFERNLDFIGGNKN